MKIGVEYVLAAITILCWGTVATTSKILMNQMDAMYALTFSFLYASLFLGIYNWKKGNLKKIKGLSKELFLRMVGVGFLGVLFYNLFLLLGTDLLPAQEAFVINYFWPAMIIIFSCILLKERFSAGKFIAVLFSFLGITLVSTNGDLHGFLGGSMKGVFFCVMAAVCYGLYCTLNKKESFDKDISVFISYVTGTIVCLVWVVAKGEIHIPSFSENFGMIWNGIICNALSFLTWAIALDKGETAVIANLAYLTPFVSLIITHFVLGEVITGYSIEGLLLIVIGIVIQFYADKSKKV